MRLTAPPRSTIFSSLILPVPLVLLIIAYLVTISRRPDIPEHAQIEDPHQWGFPNWYGNYQTPYDYKRELPGGEEEICDHPKNVLLFIDLPYDSPKIPTALTVLSSLKSSNRFNVTTISAFSPNWNIELSSKDNLMAAGCEGVDWIWRVGDASSTTDLGCNKAVWVEEEVGKPGRAHVSLFSQPHHLLFPQTSHTALKSEHGDDWELGLLTNILPASYYPSKRITSRKSIVYFPSRDTPTKEYPRLPWGKLWSIYSPSRKAPPLPKSNEDPFSPKSPWMKFWLKEEQRLAAAMREAGICLFEGWQKGELDDRIAKAMLSGCVVASAPPQTHHDAFSPLILPLSKPSSVTLTPKLPISNLNHLLSSYTTSEIQHLALKAFITARNRLIPSSRLDGVESTVKIWEEGGRGYDFKDGFRWDCDSGHGAWCG